MRYDTLEVLNAIDDHKVAVLALAGLALIGNYVYWITALRLGARDRVYPMPLVCITFFLVHDGTYVANFDLWFNEIDHWWPKLFWAGLVVTVGMELLFLRLFLRFGRQEVAPNLSQRAFVAVTIAAFAMAAAAWGVVKATMEDELYLTIFGVTIFWCAPFFLALTWRRQSTAGTSVVAWVGYLMMPLSYWPATMIMDDAFRSVLWIGLGFAAVAGGLANIALIRRLESTQSH